MELPLFSKRYWRRRQYEMLNGVSRKRCSRVVQLGRFRKLRQLKKLSLDTPKKIWRRFKEAYMEMMLRLAGNVGELNSGNGFGSKRIPKAREVKLKYTKEELEDRIVFEIYKSLVASRQLGSAYA